MGGEPNKIVTVVFKDNPSGLNMQIDSHWMKSQTPKIIGWRNLLILKKKLASNLHLVVTYILA
jgi:hypothetical protein